ncbi:hypothetical protein HY949_02215 [Candidatus Gottesmanbacteria bacterium]|nr:hypothetical protein [Candidatus Gottesmanbacteria bacterium]
MQSLLKELVGQPIGLDTIGAELRSGKRSPSDTLNYLETAAQKYQVSFGGANPDAPFAPTNQKEALAVIGEAVLRAPLSVGLLKEMGGIPQFGGYFTDEVRGANRRIVHANPETPWNQYFDGSIPGARPPLVDFTRLQSLGGSMIQGIGTAGLPGHENTLPTVEHLVTLGHIAPNVLKALNRVHLGEGDFGDVFKIARHKLDDGRRSGLSSDQQSYWGKVFEAMSKPDYAMGWLKGEFGPAPK